MTRLKIKDIFHEGAIPASFIADSIQKHLTQTTIGGHSIFLGQVRADDIDGKKIASINYTAHRELALGKMEEMRETIFVKYPIICLHVHHSLGHVTAGEICFFVFVSAAHRQAAMEACKETVEKIKAELPIWGQELFEDGTYQWKENKVEG
jgi:molybdopterin synthase catalytic subunit